MMEKILTNEKRGKENEEQVEENAKILKGQEQDEKKDDENIDAVAKKALVNTATQEALHKAGLLKGHHVPPEVRKAVKKEKEEKDKQGILGKLF
jgi:hypothetical protein